MMKARRPALFRKCCIAGLALVTIVFAATRSEACSCAGGASPCQEYGRASAVFVGTVVSVRTVPRPANSDKDETEYWAPRRFKFFIEKSFLGLTGTETEVSTGLGGGDCGYDFKIGERYVVYAYQTGRTGRLVTSICSRTNPFESAKSDLDFLRSLESERPGVTISGEIRRMRQNVATGDSGYVGPMENFAVVVEGEGERKEVRTDADGRYRLTGLSPGKFKVTLLLPDELFTYKPEQEITVADRGCATVNYSVVDNGRLSGKVLNPEGQPAAGVMLALMDANRIDPKTNWGKLVRADKDGNYSFSALPSGKYVLAVNLNRFPEPNDPTNAYPRTYYPGVTDISKAEVISLAPGENLREFNLQIPIRRDPSVINVKVVWDDGTPVANAGISFREVTYHDPQINYGIQADDQGYFTINGYIGQIFVIEARSNRPYDGDPRRLGPMERVEPLRVVVANPTEAVRIVITRLR
jgi:hypothetical protein